MKYRFNVEVETDARPSNWRLKIVFADFSVKLARDNAVDLASDIVAAIERKENSKSFIGGDSGWKLTVSIYDDVITLERWDPIEATATASLSKSEAKDLIRELVAFSEQVQRQ